MRRGGRGAVGRLWSARGGEEVSGGWTCGRVGAGLSGGWGARGVREGCAGGGEEVARRLFDAEAAADAEGGGAADVVELAEG